MGLMDWIKRSLDSPQPPEAAPGLYAKPKVPLPPATPEDWQALTDAVGQALVPDDADALGAECAWPCCSQTPTWRSLGMH